MRQALIFYMAFGLTVAMAQNKQLLYGFGDIPQSMMLNPGAKTKLQRHYGIPLLSQIHLDVGASALSAYDLFADDGVSINTKLRNKIFEMQNSDFLTVTQQLELINLGWRTKTDLYFSAGIYQELDFITYYPRDLAILAHEGNANYIDYEFDLGEINMMADLLTVYHVGVNKELTPKLTAGVRFKLYSSMASFRTTNNSGSFVTRVAPDDGENIYEHSLEDVNVTVHTSGINSLEGNEGSAFVGEVVGRAFFGGNFGVGVDVGATYEITDDLLVSASVLDIGAIFHSKDAVTYRATGNYTLDGIELVFPPIDDGDATFPYYDDLEDEFEREIPIDTIRSGYTQWRPVKMNASVAYSFGRALGNGDDCNCLNMGGDVERAQTVGLQWYGIKRPKGVQMAGTAFYQRRLFNFLAAKATYTVDPFSFKNVGLGMVVDIGKFNFYMAADNLLSYTNIAKAKHVSLQLGFNIKIDQE